MRRHRRGSISISAAERSVRSSGRLDFARTTAGSMFLSSTARDICGTMAALSMRPGCMPSGCPSSGDASRPSSMARRMTRATSSITSPGTSLTERTAGRSKPVDEIWSIDRTCTDIQIASCSFRSLASPVGRKLRAGIVNQRAPLGVHDGRRAEVPGLAQTRDIKSAQILGVRIGRELRQIRHKIHPLSGHRTSEVRPDAGTLPARQD